MRAEELLKAVMHDTDYQGVTGFLKGSHTKVSPFPIGKHQVSTDLGICGFLEGSTQVVQRTAVSLLDGKICCSLSHG